MDRVHDVVNRAPGRQPKGGVTVAYGSLPALQGWVRVGPQHCVCRNTKEAHAYLASLFVDGRFDIAAGQDTISVYYYINIFPQGEVYILGVVDGNHVVVDAYVKAVESVDGARQHALAMVEGARLAIDA